MGRSSAAVWVLSCLLLSGCATTRFQVVDAQSKQPLDVVQVDGYRFRPLEQIPSDFAWREVPVPATDKNGAVSTVQPLSLMPGENEFRFVFTKPGYRPAEVLVYNDRTIVASPADDAGWVAVENDPRHIVGNVPTRNFAVLPRNAQIQVPLFPAPVEPAAPSEDAVAPTKVPTADVK